MDLECACGTILKLALYYNGMPVYADPTAMDNVPYSAAAGTEVRCFNCIMELEAQRAVDHFERNT